MIRDDDSQFLLYIEPKKEEKLIEPINDEFTQLIVKAYNNAKKGISNYNITNDNINIFFKENRGWMGIHETDCGELSSNYDFLLENDMIVNSLCIFYIRWYRNSISGNEWNKILKLKEFYENIKNVEKTIVFTTLEFENKNIPLRVELNNLIDYNTSLREICKLESDYDYISSHIKCNIKNLIKSNIKNN